MFEQNFMGKSELSVREEEQLWHSTTATENLL
jgi:hypothetical protein